MLTHLLVETWRLISIALDPDLPLKGQEDTSGTNGARYAVKPDTL
jgi:hypothetical protein